MAIATSIIPISRSIAIRPLLRSIFANGPALINISPDTSQAMTKAVSHSAQRSGSPFIISISVASVDGPAM